MSIVTFFERVGKDIEAIFGKLFSITWEKKALIAINDAGPFIEGIVAIADPPILPLVTKIVDAVQKDLQDVTTTLQQGVVVPGSTEAQKIAAGLNSVKSNLSALLADADVKNATKVAEITSAVNVVTNTVDTILGEIPKMPAASA